MIFWESLDRCFFKKTLQKFWNIPKMPPSDSQYLPFPFTHTSLLHSLHPSLSIRDCKIGNTLHFHSTLLIWSKVTLCSAKNWSVWIRDSAPNPDRELLCPGLYPLEFLRINIDENIGRPMLPSIPNENAYLNPVVKLVLRPLCWGWGKHNGNNNFNWEEQRSHLCML